MRTQLFKIALTAGFLLVFALIFGCEEAKAKPVGSNIIGIWELDNNENFPDKESQNLAYKMEFFNDGTGIANFHKKGTDIGIVLKWQLRDDNRLQIITTVLGEERTEINDIELSEKDAMLTVHYDGRDFNGKKPRKASYAKKGTKKESSVESSYSTFTDKRDGKQYKAVKIGTQTWMAENLNYDDDGSKCYDNKSENCTKYGRLYHWEKARKVCPTGWHLPTNAEWDKLNRFADGTNGKESPYESKSAGKFLKAKNGWKNYEGKSGNGDDKYGFAALPSGGGFNDDFQGVGNDGGWWSASEIDADSEIYNVEPCCLVYIMSLYYNSDGIRWDKDDNILISVRCVKD